MLGAEIDVVAQLGLVYDPRIVVQRNLVLSAATMLTDRAPRQKCWLARPGDQLLHRSQFKQLAKDEDRHIGVGKGSVGTAGDGDLQILGPTPITKDLIAVTGGYRPNPTRRVVGADRGTTLEVLSESLGFEGPLMGDEHVDLRPSIRVHVERQDLLQPRAPHDNNLRYKDLGEVDRGAWAQPRLIRDVKGVPVLWR
jgi:hypothetical protein